VWESRGRNHAGTYKVNTFTSRRDLELGEAGSLCLELFQTFWGESEDVLTIYRCYKACLRELNGYLVCWEIPAAAAWLVLDGLEMKNELWSSRANKSNSKLVLGGKSGRWVAYIDWTSRYLKDIGAGMRCGGGWLTFVNRSEQLSSEWIDGFQQNHLGALFVIRRD